MSDPLSESVAVYADAARKHQADRLREALEGIGPLIEGGYGVVFSEDSPIVAAARRWLALTETGPDYDKSDDKAMELGYVDIVWDDLIAVVDAALADYLTEEETK